MESFPSNTSIGSKVGWKLLYWKVLRCVKVEQRKPSRLLDIPRKRIIELSVGEVVVKLFTAETNQSQFEARHQLVGTIISRVVEVVYVMRARMLRSTHTIRVTG